MKFSLAVFCGMMLFLVSCATQQENKRSVDSSTNTIEKKGLSKFEGGYSPEQDPETGFMKMKSHKPDLYEDAKSRYGKSANLKKEYSTDTYDSRRWQGVKSKERKEWGGNKQYAYSPEFVRQNAGYAAKTANEASTDFRGSSDVYETYTSREQSSERQSKDLDYKVQHRREVYVQPKIIDNQSASGSGRTVEDVKGLLND